MSSAEYEFVQKSSLKLKGVDSKAIKKKKKKSKKSKDKEKDELLRESVPSTSKSYAEDEGEEGSSLGAAAVSGHTLYRNKTKAEVSFIKRKEELDKDRIRDKASMTHKEKVEKFNTYLEGLSEHYEQAKVSWTK